MRLSTSRAPDPVRVAKWRRSVSHPKRKGGPPIRLSNAPAAGFRSASPLIAPPPGTQKFLPAQFLRETRMARHHDSAPKFLEASRQTGIYRCSPKIKAYSDHKESRRDWV